ncbi:hydroxymethylbilane synthase [Devosia insulae DS-56]|uniref:Porphobilinogen deaminase n=1 Tax=Devosia insulae DS-56 TaxID=1116389 RepID=A0A1E5XQV0_9HYPH|nr:hydroxymethylbilane synthase [Devosia insulae]OEO30959.1 hydroxymethylbilane synthase [Devosia insulae DS-56]
MQSAPFLRIGTRGSMLALAQAQLTQRLLAEAHGVAAERIEIRVITTSGDKLTDRPLSEAGGKGLFSREIEAALAAGEVDLGVHSSKDLASWLPDGMVLAAFLEREDVRDAFVSLKYPGVDALPEGAKLGSSSIRRAAQMLRVRPDLEVVQFRGNVDTRLNKLEAGVADATLLAVAGLNRLGKQDKITAYLDPKDFLPAPAQGAIGIEIREADARTAELVAVLNHAPTATTLAAERALLATLDGSCRTPIGAFTELNGVSCRLTAEILSPDGREFYRGSVEGAAADAAKLGTQLGATLLEQAGPEFQRQFKG